MTQEQIAQLEQSGLYQLSTINYQLSTEDVEIATEDMPGWLVLNEGQMTIALDIELTDELRQEGLARELVNRIQNLRKTSGFDITDRIHIQLEERNEITDTIARFGDYIASQVLAASLTLQKDLAADTLLEMDGYTLKVKLNKA